MSSVTDSLIFRHIFSTPVSAAIWSDERRTKYYLEFEAALAEVQANLGIIPPKAAVAIRSECDISLIDMQELGVETVRIGYPVLPLVKQLVRLVNEVEPGLGEWAHWGATTQVCGINLRDVCKVEIYVLQDVTDTATVLQLRDTCNIVSESLNGITAALRALARKHAATPMPARSNLQQAVPMTFGFKMARLLATFQRHQQRLSEILPRLLVLEFGGAAGTLATLASTGKAMEVQAALAQRLGLAAPDIAWHTERDRIAEIGAFFALVTGTASWVQ